VVETEAALSLQFRQLRVRLPPQMRSLTIAGLIVWFAQEQPYGFRDRASAWLMTRAGWIVAAVH
jgi:hypothetical protein